MKCALTCGYATPADRLVGPAVVVFGENERPRASELQRSTRGLADRKGSTLQNDSAASNVVPIWHSPRVRKPEPVRVDRDAARRGIAKSRKALAKARVKAVRDE